MDDAQNSHRSIITHIHGSQKRQINKHLLPDPERSDSQGMASTNQDSSSVPSQGQKTIQVEDSRFQEFLLSLLIF